MNGQGATLVVGFAVPLLSLIILTPWFGAAVLALLSPSMSAARSFTLLVSATPLVFAALALANFDPTVAAPQFVERHIWISSLGV